MTHRNKLFLWIRDERHSTKAEKYKVEISVRRPSAVISSLSCHIANVSCPLELDVLLAMALHALLYTVLVILMVMLLHVSAST